MSVAGRLAGEPLKRGLQGLPGPPEASESPSAEVGEPAKARSHDGGPRRAKAWDRGTSGATYICLERQTYIIYTYIHACMHTYIHSYIHPYLPT